MKYYMTRWNKIHEVEIEKETAHFVWIGGRRYSKKTSECYFGTREEAKGYLVVTARKKLEDGKSRVDTLRNKLREVVAL